MEQHGASHVILSGAKDQVACPPIVAHRTWCFADPVL